MPRLEPHEVKAFIDKYSEYLQEAIDDKAIWGRKFARRKQYTPRDISIMQANAVYECLRIFGYSFRFNATDKNASDVHNELDDFVCTFTEPHKRSKPKRRKISNSQ